MPKDIPPANPQFMGPKKDAQSEKKSGTPKAKEPLSGKEEFPTSGSGSSKQAMYAKKKPTQPMSETMKPPASANPQNMWKESNPQTLRVKRS